MKLIHLSDLHIGKRVNEFSMLEDQEYILIKIINIIDEEKPDTVLICGDVYDKPVPSAEAVALFDNFLAKLSTRNLNVFIISGNHDSPERIAFGGRIMQNSGIYLSPVYNKDILPVTLRDNHGDCYIYMLPFIKPAHVRACFADTEITSYTQAVEVAINAMNIDTTKRNILLTHQFVTGAERCDSEDISVGGSDNVSATVFEAFDYVALGHIHKPQRAGSETIRYSGSPLKYSFSEANHKKSVTVVEIGEKGSIAISTIPLIPKRDMKEIKGDYATIVTKSFYKDFNLEDYYHITLTDEDDILDALSKLRTIYKNIMKLDYDNKRTRSNAAIDNIEDVETKSPITLFAEFYELQNNNPMSKNQEAFLSTIIEKIWESEK